jgi:hypothetical protein
MKNKNTVNNFASQNRMFAFRALLNSVQLQLIILMLSKINNLSEI